MLKQIMLQIENNKLLESIENYVLSGRLIEHIRSFKVKPADKNKIKPVKEENSEGNKTTVEEI